MFKKILKKIKPEQCYNCGKMTYKWELLPVRESARDLYNLPQAPFCRKCARKIKHQEDYV